MVNGPKTWSLAAALHPEIADGLRRRAGPGGRADHRLGRRARHHPGRTQAAGRCRCRSSEIEAAVVRHYTSRAGDPHRHLHLQINARVFAEGQWRGLHSVGMRDSPRGDQRHRPRRGRRATPSSAPRSPRTGSPSTRPPVSSPSWRPTWARSVRGPRRSAATSTATRPSGAHANPGAEPGPGGAAAWDRRAWKDARPDKVVPTDGADLVGGVERAAARPRLPRPAPQVGLPIVARRTAGRVRSTATPRSRSSWSRLGARRSAWNAADIRGEVEQCDRRAPGSWPTPRSGSSWPRTSPPAPSTACVPLLPRAGRARAHPRPDLTATCWPSRPTSSPGSPAAPSGPPTPAVLSPDARRTGLDELQRAAVAALAGDAELVVVEGAAGAGKTTTLAATQDAARRAGPADGGGDPDAEGRPGRRPRDRHRAFSAAWLVHQHGWRWDDDGRWTREAARPRSPEAVLGSGDLLLVDEAGMLDQDTARALLTVADETGARVALVGDRHQLPAVGRGGVLDLAARWARPEAPSTSTSCTGSPTPSTPRSASRCAPAPPPTPRPARTR